MIEATRRAYETAIGEGPIAPEIARRKTAWFARPVLTGPSSGRPPRQTQQNEGRGGDTAAQTRLPQLIPDPSPEQIVNAPVINTT